MGANLKEVRERIVSVNGTQQITKAMKMVSAAKLKKSQDGITKMKPYALKLKEILGNIMANVDGDSSSTYGTERELKRVAVVVVTSNRGLCGAFNNNVIKEAVSHIKGSYSDLVEAKHVDLICIGKKGGDFFKKNYGDLNINRDYQHVIDKYLFSDISELGEYLMKSFRQGTYDAIDVVYGTFKNAAAQFPVTERFLPVEQAIAEEEVSTSKMKNDYLFEPDEKTLLEHLIPQILVSQLQSYILDTSASEHGARMTAMDKATENANDLIKDLKIMYNKARQEAITSEISEIVGGAAALQG